MKYFLLLSFYISTYTTAYYLQLHPDSVNGHIIGINYEYMNYLQILLYNLAIIGLFSSGYFLTRNDT